MSGRSRPRRPNWSVTFIEDLQIKAAEHPDAVEAMMATTVGEGSGRAARLTLNTQGLARRPRGLDLQPQEDVLVVPGSSPLVPPKVYVSHDRFAGFPHVLGGDRAFELCIYLDPGREWDPDLLSIGFLHRLYGWLDDAAAARFDPETALFHPVGGRAHTTITGPTIVVREELRFTKRIGLTHLSRRNDRRYDLTPEPSDDLAETVITIRLDRPLVHGPGTNVGSLAARVRADGGPDLLQVLPVRLQRLVGTDAAWCHVVLAVPRPRHGTYYLMVGRFPLSVNHSEYVLANQTLEWCTMSDERASVATRRDHHRPINALHGKHLAVVGCGGLGSWIAEFAARAGVASLELSDYGQVSGGLLVRQNYLDADIGHSKADALARRVDAVAPAIDITVNNSGAPSQHTLELLGRDDGIVIDATVNRAMGRMLESLRQPGERQGLHAQVLTDIATASLGLIAVDSGEDDLRVSRLDALSGDAVRRGSELEHYRVFWDDSETDELIANPGCSYPTFHGSAADIAAVAAETMNLISLHVTSRRAGVHLIALPHTGVHPSHVFLSTSDLTQSSAGGSDAAGRT